MGNVYQKISIQQVDQLQAILDALNSNTTTPASILADLLTVDGTGSGLDADLLDGYNSSDFVLTTTYTPGDILAKILTVDGSGSGLDADLLDGLNSSAFVQTTRTITAGNGLSGGGDLSTNKTISLATPSSITSSSTNVANSTTHAHALVLSASDLTTILGYTPWHAGNDGAGSGLDADLLDGLSSASFIQTSGDQTAAGVKTWSSNANFSANVTVTGRLSAGESIRLYRAAAQAYSYISGDAGQYRALQFGSGSAHTPRFLFGINNTAESGSNVGSDLFINSYDDAGAFIATPLQIIRSTGVTRFSVTPVVGAGTANTVWHRGNDGSGSGLDADLLDGYNSDAFPRKTEATVGVTGLWTFSANATFSANVTVSGSALYTTIGIANNYLMVDRTGQAAASYAYIQGDVGAARGIQFRTGSSSRWLFYADTTAEAGSNAGSALRLTSYADDGATATPILTVLRSAANVNFWATPYVGGVANTIWHAGNDGTGSNLDADQLDGYDAIAFPRKAENATITGAWTFAGNVTFAGATTIVSSTNLNVEDAIITVASNNSSGAVAYSGLKFERGLAGNDAYMVWNEASDVFQFGTAADDAMTSFARSRILASSLDLNVATGTAPLTVSSSTVVTNLNADLLDGYDASAFPRKAEAATISGQWTFTPNANFSSNLFVSGNLTSNSVSANTFIAANNFQGSLRLSSAQTVFGVSPSSNGRTVYDLVQYRSNSSTTTGAIVFMAPDTTSSVMHYFHIRGSEHEAPGLIDLHVRGYRTTGAWGTTALAYNGPNRPQVRWGVTPDGKNCIILGDVGTVWDYPHVAIAMAMFAHTGSGDAYCTGWTASLVTDLSLYTNVVGIADSSEVPFALTANNATNFGGQAASYYAQSARSIAAGNGLTGGGNLTADRTISLATPSSISGSSTNVANSTTHSHALVLASADITGALGYTPWHAGNDGAGTGLDADLLDGMQATSFVWDTQGLGANGLADRVRSGHYQLNGLTTGASAKGFPVDGYDWWHGLVTTHTNGSNYFSMQFASAFGNGADLYFRNVGQSGLTGANSSAVPWDKVWTNRNDGAGSGLDADMLDGSQRDTAFNSFGNGTIPVRHSSGYLYSNYFNMTADNQTAAPTRVAIETSSDGFLRWQDPKLFLAHNNGGRYYSGILGGATDLGWKKIATVTLSSTTYNDVGFDVEIVDGGSNYGGDADVRRYRYSAQCERSAAADGVNAGELVGYSGYPHIQIVKVQNGSGATPAIFEIQARQPYNYTQWSFTIQPVTQLGNVSVTYHTTATAGSTGIATYGITDGGGIPGIYENAMFSDYLTVVNTATLSNTTLNGVTTFTESVWHKAGSTQRLHFSASGANYFKSPTGQHIFRASNDADTVTIANNGNISTIGEVTGYSSDAKLKRNVRPIANAMFKISSIGGYEFDWDMDLAESVGFSPTNVTEHGVLAQEIQKVMPDAVRPAAFGNGEYLTVKYERLVSLLIEGMKEQQAKINSLEEKVELLMKLAGVE